MKMLNVFVYFTAILILVLTILASVLGSYVSAKGPKKKSEFQCVQAEVEAPVVDQPTHPIYVCEQR